MKSSVALIGFMGVGKTSVGRAIARKLGKKFVELDLIIAWNAGKSIPEIFEHYGEIAFRELEIQAVKGLVGKKNLVISCGGGVVLNRINIDRLKQEAVVVLLTATPSTIVKRTSGSAGRPLLSGKCTIEEVRLLLKSRQPLYEQAADIKVDTSQLDIHTVTEEILTKLKEYESQNK